MLLLCLSRILSESDVYGGSAPQAGGPRGPSAVAAALNPHQDSTPQAPVQSPSIRLLEAQLAGGGNDDIGQSDF